LFDNIKIFLRQHKPKLNPSKKYTFIVYLKELNKFSKVLRTVNKIYLFQCLRAQQFFKKKKVIYKNIILIFLKILFFLILLYQNDQKTLKNLI
jgi:hypothetical protein